jgi:hypothetical protein
MSDDARAIALEEKLAKKEAASYRAEADQYLTRSDGISNWNGLKDRNLFAQILMELRRIRKLMEERSEQN